MRPIVSAIVALLVVVGPAAARDRLRHDSHQSRRNGIPIIAGNNDIRINAVGEVLSTPPPPISSRSPRQLAPVVPQGNAAKP